MRTPVLETERLVLRPVTVADAEAAWLWTSDEDVNRYMNYMIHKTLQDTIDWLKMEEAALESDTMYDFGFVLKKTGELIGTGGLGYRKDCGMWELGYNLRKDCWNRGLATEAAARILQFGREELHIKKFLARHAKENPASGRVMEKNGFRYVKEGTYQKADGSMTFESREYELLIE